MRAKGVHPTAYPLLPATRTVVRPISDLVALARLWCRRKGVTPNDRPLRIPLSLTVADADLVFRSTGGGHISEGLDNSRWHDALRGAGISRVGRNVHAARHTAASNLVRAGVPLSVVKEIMGHSTIAITQLYVTTTDTEQGQAMRALDAYLA
ncbi:tyrosine-type recombinase/integrase [Cellulomonas phragmiteti]|uniref:Tyr recombinase domain-containing protein n=1 Tax=Cellulomonas phragmiteti TaxID=478780 RepID=A0ABQ4DN07_9CELL|nr:tyrosine-type recombinase/integrase [Cellulomonas phragmiteti]GIG40740.1 hypothetical protein Cph01nite_25020 [Cellulomonas phragmiteti]